MKVNVVLRTCDRVSLASDRIVPKDECIKRCLNSLVTTLDHYGDYQLHIIDDASSSETKNAIIALAQKSRHATIEFLQPRDQTGMNNKQKSRFSVQKAYEYIYNLPDNELVYIVEDDYLHYTYSLEKMVDAWKLFTLFSNNRMEIGIFPQDFQELYLSPLNQFNETYVRECTVLRGPDRYYRSTWFTHESFMIRSGLFKKYKEEFDKLLLIGEVEGMWEGLCLSNVWTKPEVKMLMPMRTLALHVSKKEDIPFYIDNFEEVWEANKV